MLVRNHFPFSLKALHDHLSGELKETVIAREKLSLGIGITSRCNFSCPICYYHSSDGVAAQDMPIELLRKILEGGGPFSSLIFAHQGEPFCHPRILEALELATEHCDNLSITSNGSLLSPNVIKHLGSMAFSNFFLSVDAGDNQTYAFMRRGGLLSSFLRNSEWLVDTLGDVVQFYAIICEQNLHSLKNLPILAAQIGVHTINFGQIRLHPYAQQAGISKASEEKIKYTLLELAEISEKHGVQIQIDKFLGSHSLMQWINRHILHKNNFSESFPYCSVPWIYTSILADGKLFPCCGDFQPEDIDTFSFDGIYNHRYLRYIRHYILSGHKLPACVCCKYL